MYKIPVAFKKIEKNILSAKCSLKFANSGKRQEVSRLVDEYHRVCQLFVDSLWDMEKVPSLVSKEIIAPIKSQTWLSARMLQACGKQASGIVRGTKKKREQQLFVLKGLVEDGRFKQARRLQRKIDETNMSRPTLKRVQLELDGRFVEDIDLDNSTSFDVWVTIGSTERGCRRLVLPVKRTKTFNELIATGKLTNGIRLSKDALTFCFDMPVVPAVTSGTTVGLDVGVRKLFACSDGQVSLTDDHGWTMQRVAERIARRRRGSKGFQRAVAHRDSFIHWSVKQLNLDGIMEIRMEDLRGLKNRPVSRVVRGWLYPTLQECVEETCKRRGVLVEQVSPTFTSQRCSHCGWTRRANRKGESFQCKSCGFAADADWNASLNLSLYLVPLSGRERRGKSNVIGFFWHEVSRGQEHMVPGVQRCGVS